MPNPMPHLRQRAKPAPPEVAQHAHPQKKMPWRSAPGLWPSQARGCCLGPWCQPPVQCSFSQQETRARRAQTNTVACAPVVCLHRTLPSPQLCCTGWSGPGPYWPPPTALPLRPSNQSLVTWRVGQHRVSLHPKKRSICLSKKDLPVGGRPGYQTLHHLRHSPSFPLPQCRLNKSLEQHWTARQVKDRGGLM